jgi:hypothetical protein
MAWIAATVEFGAQNATISADRMVVMDHLEDEPRSSCHGRVSRWY